MKEVNNIEGILEVESVEDVSLSESELWEIINKVYIHEKNEKNNHVNDIDGNGYVNKELNINEIINRMSSYKKPKKQSIFKLNKFLKKELKKFNLSKETYDIFLKDVKNKARKNERFMNLFVKDVSVDSSVLHKLKTLLIENNFLIPSFKIYCDSNSCYQYLSEEYDIEYQKILYDLLLYSSKNNYSKLEDFKNQSQQKLIDDFIKIYIKGCPICSKKVDFNYLIGLFTKLKNELFTIDYVKFNI